jgi:hypothetical protein
MNCKEQHTLNNIGIKYNLKFSVNKTKAMAMKGKMDARTKIVINSFNYLGYTITVTTEIQK